MKLMFFLALLSSVFAASVAAEEFVEIDGKQPVVIRPDRAYFLFRADSKWFAPVFLRVPTSNEITAFYAGKRAAFDKARPELEKAHETELAKYRLAVANGRATSGAEPPPPSIENFSYFHEAAGNLQSINLGKALEKGPNSRTYLIEAVPGDYVLYGVGGTGVMPTCLCLGTVSFSAKAGEISDLGQIYTAVAWQPSDNLLLKNETGLGASVNGHWVLPAIAIVPAKDGSMPPAMLAGKITRPVQYGAVGKFVGPPVFSINRLAPIPGILGYDRGNVIDLRTGKVAIDRD
jgi:hypothetical protein